MRWKVAVCVTLVTLTAATYLASCGGGDDGGGGGGTTTTTVNVTVREFMVIPERASAPAGNVKFEVSNEGEDMHEFLVIRTDLAPDALPTEDNGSYEEDGPGTELLEEIEEIDPGETEELELDLSPGNYVLICNMVHTEDNGEVEVHYALGMHTAFTVN